MHTLDQFIKSALEEDVYKGDLTTLATIPAIQKGKADCIVKEDCIIAGVELAISICNEINDELVCTFNYKDGDFVKAGETIGTITGSIHAILKAERLLLNCMQRMSAIASKTKLYADLVKPFNVLILDTRKTTPNFRICEKWAVLIGGGVNHRFGLYDAILIKDNHIEASGGIKNALVNCELYIMENNLEVPVIVEVKNLEEFKMAVDFNFVDRILIDNFLPESIHEIIECNNKRKKIEASGGINMSNITEFAKTGVDYISIGDLTHHVSSIDISLKIK